MHIRPFHAVLCEMGAISFLLLKAQMSPEQTNELSRDNLDRNASSTETCLLIFTNTVCLQLITDRNRKGLMMRST